MSPPLCRHLQGLPLAVWFQVRVSRVSSLGKPRSGLRGAGEPPGSEQRFLLEHTQQTETCGSGMGSRRSLSSPVHLRARWGLNRSRGGRRRTAAGTFEERVLWLPAVSRERDLENQSPGLSLVCLTWKGFWGQLESTLGIPLGCLCLQIRVLLAPEGGGTVVTVRSSRRCQVGVSAVPRLWGTGRAGWSRGSWGEAPVAGEEPHVSLIRLLSSEWAASYSTILISSLIKHPAGASKWVLTAMDWGLFLGVLHSLSSSCGRSWHWGCEDTGTCSAGPFLALGREV